ncbi:MAG TPA: hypothetical protein VF266_03745 [Thermoanaerobaculia bacterium]
MTCPHLEETSALFDGAAIDRTHADACGECQAFLRDAAQLRESLRVVTFETRRRYVPLLVPAAIVLCLVLFLMLRPEKIEDDGPFAGLDGGERAVIVVKP